MSEADTFPINDAEAEAVLLALGARLKWHATGASKTESAETQDGLYTIRLRTSRHSPAFYAPVYILLAGKNRGFDREHPYGRKCKNLTAAKAACERHHATGEWE